MEASEPRPKTSQRAPAKALVSVYAIFVCFWGSQLYYGTHSFVYRLTTGDTRHQRAREFKEPDEQTSILRDVALRAHSLHTGKAIHRVGKATSRGLSTLAGWVPPPLIALNDLIEHKMRRAGHHHPHGGRAPPAALELGCGEGRALLQVQQRFPNAHTACINSKTYYDMFQDRRNIGNGLLAGDNSEEAILASMKSFGLVPITETEITFRPPDVRMGDYVNDVGLAGFPPQSFDLVFSQNALNGGKLDEPSLQFPQIATKVAQVLRAGGVAVLHCENVDMSHDARITDVGVALGNATHPPGTRYNPWHVTDPDSNDDEGIDRKEEVDPGWLLHRWQEWAATQNKTTNNQENRFIALDAASFASVSNETNVGAHGAECTDVFSFIGLNRGRQAALMVVIHRTRRTGCTRPLVPPRSSRQLVTSKDDYIHRYLDGLHEWLTGDHRGDRASPRARGGKPV